MKMTEDLQKDRKDWEKEKLFIRSNNLSFSHSVFEGVTLQTSANNG